MTREGLPPRAYFGAATSTPGGLSKRLAAERHPAEIIRKGDARLRLAVDAGVPEASVCRSNRAARGLPRELHRAIRRATGPRNESLACWLDQAVREDESLYVQIYKGEPWAQPQNGSLRVPTCASPPGWLPCPSA